ncbi:hypothetical protein Srubr_12010 [Streptomyces rubradiris]|uniref:Uncharacterized protein n=1 Tax=Streptomyces rubradiris TaxID=285531 RepID=A0ABQ3R673_STRRR|nr:hypothetical protein Srubr_12010 [Streptomyces rubradiris]
MPSACRVEDNVMSSAALRARRFISTTVRITGWFGAAVLISRARANAGRRRAEGAKKLAASSAARIGLSSLV